jgi:hypothetical protein
MPRLDGTGPQGKGPMTGRGLGKCKKASDGSKNEANISPCGKVMGTGAGRGRGASCGQGRGRNA